MDSIKDLFITGYGPSSSHTIGPYKACEYIKNKYKNVEHVSVSLFGSLALTGKGHGTDNIIKRQFENTDCKVKFIKDRVVRHPNTMEFVFTSDGKTYKEKIISVGGGTIITSDNKKNKKVNIYKEKDMTEILSYCKKNNISLYEYVIEHEGEEIKEYFYDILKTIEHNIENGINNEGILPGKLHVQRKAKILYEKAVRRGINNEDYLVMAAALAASEENAAGEMVVTGPTCGSCGVIPGVVKFLRIRNYDDEKIVEALIVAALVGKIIKSNATVSGAVGGCQAEIGSACAMGAAMVVYAFNGGNVKIAQAGEIALEHSLGLTCDPVGGYVIIPCIERNAIYAVKAITSAKLSLLIDPTSEKIHFDDVVKTMYETGKDMKAEYKETSKKGLSKVKLH